MIFESSLFIKIPDEIKTFHPGYEILKSRDYTVSFLTLQT